MIEKIDSITKEAACMMDVNVITEGINSLICAGYYESREKLLDDAFRTMLEVRPTLKTEMAVELYKTGKISLSRAAEIMGTSAEGFKNISMNIWRFGRHSGVYEGVRGVEFCGRCGEKKCPLIGNLSERHEDGGTNGR